MVHSKGQTIFRVKKADEDRYTTVLNSTIRDERLSFRATGLLVYLLSMPPDWRTFQGEIVTHKTEGRDAMVTAWRELEAFDYIKKEVVRDKGVIVTTIWTVYEQPDRIPEKPKAVEPKAENPPLLIKHDNEKRIERNTATAAPSLDLFSDVDTESVKDKAERIWSIYPKKVGKPAGLKKIIAALRFVKFDHLLDRVTVFAEARQSGNPQFTPHPATWFGQERYNDPPETWVSASETRPAQASRRYETGAERKARESVAQYALSAADATPSYDPMQDPELQ